MSLMSNPTPTTGDNPEIQAFARTATRLHPTPGAPTADESHIGGPLRWPDDEPWPHCQEPLPAGIDTAGTAFVPVAQFFRRDFPGLPFPDGHDLLQLLWCPNAYEHDTHHHDYFAPLVRLVWRDSASLSGPDFQPPTPVIVENEWRLAGTGRRVQDRWVDAVVPDRPGDLLLRRLWLRTHAHAVATHL